MNGTASQVLRRRAKPPGNGAPRIKPHAPSWARRHVGLNLARSHTSATAAWRKLYRRSLPRPRALTPCSCRVSARACGSRRAHPWTVVSRPQLPERGTVCRATLLIRSQRHPAGPVPAMPAARIESGTHMWQRSSATRRHRQLKLHAVKQYVSQLPQLGLRQRGLGYLRLRRMLWHEARMGGETIAWPKAT